MSARAGWGSWRAQVSLALGSLALASTALTSVGCASSDMTLDFSSEQPDYQLGGQTGSLVPGCGVAPLSAEGQSVPAGEALAVFYAKDCPELAGEGRLALTGVGLEPQRLELVRLTGDTYLLRASASVPPGDYQLTGTDEASALRVTEGELLVPSSFGALSFTPDAPEETEPEMTAAQCPEQLRFTLELDEAALALAPLARFDVSIDRGAEQLWVDYGALHVESDDAGSRGLLELPRCAGQGCISPGPHHLALRVRLAGQLREPEPLELDFEPCPWPESASDAPDESCALTGPTRGSGGVGLGLLAVVLGLGWRRRRESRPALSPHCADPLRERDPT
jgi:MYXO-CTERM domain-containing protein